jgi:hypothetical protein
MGQNLGFSPNRPSQPLLIFPQLAYPGPTNVLRVAYPGFLFLTSRAAPWLPHSPTQPTHSQPKHGLRPESSSPRNQDRSHRRNFPQPKIFTRSNQTELPFKTDHLHDARSKSPIKGCASTPCYFWCPPPPPRGLELVIFTLSPRCFE